MAEFFDRFDGQLQILGWVVVVAVIFLGLAKISHLIDTSVFRLLANVMKEVVDVVKRKPTVGAVNLIGGAFVFVAGFLAIIEDSLHGWATFLHKLLNDKIEEYHASVSPWALAAILVFYMLISLIVVQKKSKE